MGYKGKGKPMKVAGGKTAKAGTRHNSTVGAGQFKNGTKGGKG